MPRSRAWVVYLVRCRDNTLYCGVTNDLAARLAVHGTARGAKYTRNRGPVQLVYVRKCRGKRAAMRLEYRIKQLTRREKLALVAAYTAVDDVAEHPSC
ncbi:MAG TPA: GIY-YIG nuclease family protein [Kofleriaceae bacterium]